jgi:hypothetical protein
MVPLAPLATMVNDASTGVPLSNETVTVSTTSGSRPPCPAASPVTRSGSAADGTAPSASRTTVTCVIGSPAGERYLSGPEAETAAMTGTVTSAPWPATIRTEVR